MKPQYTLRWTGPLEAPQETSGAARGTLQKPCDKYCVATSRKPFVIPTEARPLRRPQREDELDDGQAAT